MGMDESTHFCDDRDGKAYKYVTIGDQVWMAENLAYKPKASICQGSYGCYYTWSQAMNIGSEYNSKFANMSDRQGSCPEGWHLPKSAEWSTLTNTIVASSAGTQLKTVWGWNSDGNGTYDWGFSALPAGEYTNSSFKKIGDFGYWWTSTEHESSPSGASYRHMYYSYATVYSNSSSKNSGFSVRCVKD
jgi:uncharacterized protein (TIGR02145 family)